MEKRKTSSNSTYQHDDRNITCEHYTLEKEDKMCKVCSNKVFCRKSRKSIVSRERNEALYKEKADWQNFINEVTQPRLMPIKNTVKQALVDHDNKVVPMPTYRREGNILKLNWDGFYARSKEGKEKSRRTHGVLGAKSVLSRKAIREIRFGNVPVLEIEI